MTVSSTEDRKTVLRTTVLRYTPHRQGGINSIQNDDTYILQTPNPGNQSPGGGDEVLLGRYGNELS
jgi:hypothetical protein